MGLNLSIQMLASTGVGNADFSFLALIPIMYPSIPPVIALCIFFLVLPNHVDAAEPAFYKRKCYLSMIHLMAHGLIFMSLVQPAMKAFGVSGDKEATATFLVFYLATFVIIALAQFFIFKIQTRHSPREEDGKNTLDN